MNQQQKKYKTLMLLLLATLSLPLSVWADITPSTKNSVIVKVPLTPTTSPTELSEQNSIVKVQYTDGLGRPTIIVSKSIVQGKDLVSVKGYNAYGEVGSEWLPVPVTAATSCPSSATVMQAAKSFYNDNMPYSTVETTYDANGQSTVQIAPGAKWHNGNKTQQIQLTSSLAYGNIRRYVVVGNAVKLFPASADLVTQVSIVKDEDGKEVYNFIDNEGTLLMQRTVANATNHDTYYVYNDMGQLCFVLSPEATERMNTAGTTYSVGGINTDNNPLSQFAFVYRYDAKGQCIAKKLPGKDWCYMVYDRGGRLAFSIEGNQRATTGIYTWTFYKYDTLNRLVVCGITQYDVDSPPNYDNTDALASYNANSGYTYSAPLGSNTKILTANYYDNYDFLTNTQYPGLKYVVPSPTPNDLNSLYNNKINGVDIATLGKLTGTYVAELKSSGCIFTAMFYNQRGQVIQSNSKNSLGGYDNDNYTYNFAGQVLANNHKHTTTNISISEDYTYKYDARGRLTSINHLIPAKGPSTSLTVVMDSLLYDEVGRVTQKQIHGGMQSINYTYNVRNQLKSISSSKFSELINYADDDSNQDTKEAYNGNITSVSYGAGATYKYKYNYTYDDMNRLTEANYTDLLNSANDGTYTEEFKGYDLNSNIKELTRTGLVKKFKDMAGTTPDIVKHDMDQLTMTYAGNRVKAITDGNLTSEYAAVGGNDFVDKQSASQPTEYFYDANGNQTADYNKGIAWIKYNLLNLPEKIQFTNGNKIEYNYYADGSKKQAIYYTTMNLIDIPLGATTTENFAYNSTFTQDYCGRYIYENYQLKRVLTPEGYAKFNGTNSNYYWNYMYFLKDHLGNTHISMESQNLPLYSLKTGFVRGTTEYYPSGMEIRPTATNASGTNTYLYGGKELDRMHGLNEYDFSARWYDYAGPAFTTMDPHAENHYSESPYAYCAGNPVNRTDITGMDWYRYENSVGTRFKWFDKENRDSFDGTDMGKKVTYKHMGPEIFFKDEKGDQYHGTDNGEYEKLTPLITIEVHSTRLYRPNYGSGNSNSISGIAEDRSAGGDNANAGFTNNLNISAYLLGTMTSAYDGILARQASSLERLGKAAFANRRPIAKALNLNKAMRIGTKAVGKKLLGVGVVLSLIDVYNEGGSAKSWGWATADTVMGAVGVFGGPVGIAASVLYSTGRIGYQIYEESQNQQ